MTVWRSIASVLWIGACGGAAPVAHEAPVVAPMEAAPTSPSSTYQPPYWPPVNRPPRLAVPDTITRDSRAYIEALNELEAFALGGVGVTGSHYRGETITLFLADHPDAVEAFAWLAGHGKPIAWLYAYWALRTLAPERARTFAAALEADRTVIPTMSGCLDGRARVGSIARGMRAPRARAMPKP